MKVQMGVHACEVRKDYFFELFLENVRAGTIFRAHLCPGVVTVVEGNKSIETRKFNFSCN